MPDGIYAPDLPGIDLIREETRQFIVYWAIGGFLILLGVIVLGGWLFLKLPTDDILKVLTATASILGGVVGAVVGFYFRSEQNSSEK